MKTIATVGKPSGAFVAQDELDALIALQNQIRRLYQIFRRQATDVLTRLESGASVEPGTHSAELETTTSGSERRTRVIIDGGRLLH